MDVERAGRIGRILRVRARLTQSALALRAGVTRKQVSRFELGGGRGQRVRTIEAILGALGARVRLNVMWNGPDLDRLLDAGHAAMAASVKRRLERWHWLVRVEASYSRYGERGRIDLLAFHPATGTLLVIEIKTILVDVQQLLGSLDTKVRNARPLARDLGWEPRTVIPALVFAEDGTTRRHIAQLDVLFDRFTLRGREALSWLHRPGASPPAGVLWFSQVPAGERVSGKRRVYPRSTAA